MIKGSYTVESTFLMMMTIWIIVAIISGGMFVHDRIILSSCTSEKLETLLEDEDNVNDKSWCSNIKEDLNKKLMLLDVTNVNISDSILEKTVTVKYNVMLSLEGMKKFLLNNGKKSSFILKREKVNPSIYKWDYDIAKGR